MTRSTIVCAIAATGTIVHVEGFGLVKAFRIVAPNGDTEHWITNDLGMDDLRRRQFAELAWQIEEYHRGLKQATEVERTRRLETRAIPPALDFHALRGMRTEARQKLDRFRPATVGSAARLAGVTPADITVLLVHLERLQQQVSA